MYYKERYEYDIAKIDWFICLLMGILYDKSRSFNIWYVRICNVIPVSCVFGVMSNELGDKAQGWHMICIYMALWLLSWGFGRVWISKWSNDIMINVLPFLWITVTYIYSALIFLYLINSVEEYCMMIGIWMLIMKIYNLWISKNHFHSLEFHDTILS